MTANLAGLIRDNDGHLSTGFPGTRTFCSRSPTSGVSMTHSTWCGSADHTLGFASWNLEGDTFTLRVEFPVTTVRVGRTVAGPKTRLNGATEADLPPPPTPARKGRHATPT